MVDHRDARVQDALDRIISQYGEDALNLRTIIETLSSDSQDVEDTCRDLIENRWLNSSEGKQLDMYGEALDVAREGEPDDEIYRTRIKARIVRYQSSGQHRKIVDAFILLANLDSVHLQERFPAAIKLHGVSETGDVLGDVSDIRDTLRNSKAAGVGIEEVALSKIPPFAFLGYPLDAEGFVRSDIPDYGGYLSELREDLRPKPTFGFQGASGFVAGFAFTNPPNPLEGGTLIFE